MKKVTTNQEKRSFREWLICYLLGFEDIYTRSVRYTYKVGYINNKISLALIERDETPYCVFRAPDEFVPFTSYDILPESRNIMLEDLRGIERKKLYEVTLSHDIRNETPRPFIGMCREIYTFLCELKRP